LVPILFIVATAGLLLNSLFQRPGPTVASFAAILAGVPIYFLWRRR
jgi:hypothetical protein